MANTSVSGTPNAQISTRILEFVLIMVLVSPTFFQFYRHGCFLLFFSTPFRTSMFWTFFFGVFRSLGVSGWLIPPKFNSSPLKKNRAAPKTQGSPSNFQPNNGFQGQTCGKNFGVVGLFVLMCPLFFWDESRGLGCFCLGNIGFRKRVPVFSVTTGLFWKIWTTLRYVLV